MTIKYNVAGFNCFSIRFPLLNSTSENAKHLRPDINDEFKNKIKIYILQITKHDIMYRISMFVINAISVTQKSSQH